jgi:hypothetical protein
MGAANREFLGTYGCAVRCRSGLWCHRIPAREPLPEPRATRSRSRYAAHVWARGLHGRMGLRHRYPVAAWHSTERRRNQAGLNGGDLVDWTGVYSMVGVDLFGTAS